MTKAKRFLLIVSIAWMCSILLSIWILNSPSVVIVENLSEQELSHIILGAKDGSYSLNDLQPGQRDSRQFHRGVPKELRLEFMDPEHNRKEWKGPPIKSAGDLVHIKIGPDGEVTEERESKLLPGLQDRFR